MHPQHASAHDHHVVNAAEIHSPEVWLLGPARYGRAQHGARKPTQRVRSGPHDSSPGGDTWGQWVKDAGTLDFQAVAVYDVTSSADANADALSAGASTFLWQSWGPAKVDLENIESWAGVPGGLTGHQIYPTESTRNAKRRDNRFWLVPVGPSRFVVGVSAPEGAHAAELAQAVAASIGAGPCP